MSAQRRNIDTTASLFAQAAAANVATSGRRGNVVELEADNADDVMITADLHGHRPNFDRILDTANLDAHPGRHLVLQEVCHGGPTDDRGGCRSYVMLEDVARLKAAYPHRVHFLLSNHELAELTDFPIVKGRRVLNLSFRLGLQNAYGEAADQVRQAYLPFLRSCPLAVRVSDGLFVCHSLPEAVETNGFDVGVFERQLSERDLKSGGPAFQLVWGRDFRSANAEAFAQLVRAGVLVHGHEPCQAGFLVPNSTQVILDSCTTKGCYLLVAAGQPHSHEEIVGRIQHLDPQANSA